MADVPWGELDHQADLGPLARRVGPLLDGPAGGRGGRPPVTLAAVVLPLAAAATLLDAPRWLVVVAAVVAVVALGAGLRPPLRHPLAWTVPSTLYALEVLVVGLLQHDVDPGRWAAVFALSAAVAYRRYDVIYRLRDLGAPPPPWTRAVTLGVDGRLLVVAVVALVRPERLFAVLLLLAAWVGLVVVAESTVAWTRWLRGGGRG